MTLKDKLQQLKTTWTSLATQIKSKLRTQSQTLTQTQTKLNEANQFGYSPTAIDNQE